MSKLTKIQIKTIKDLENAYFATIANFPNVLTPLGNIGQLIDELKEELYKEE